MAKGRGNKRGIAVAGAWQPVPLDLLRSRACAELSPHAAKLLLFCLGALGTNASRNGDICLSHKVLATYGWASRATLNAAVRELTEASLLFQTRQGGRLDCSLWALTPYPLDCDLKKLDVRPGCYMTGGWRMAAAGADKPPTATSPARWKQARKLKTVAPSRNDPPKKRSRAEQTLPHE